MAADITMISPVAWVALAIECPDAEAQERLRHFYAQALGGEVVSGSVRARGWLLIFQVIADYKPPTWPVLDTPKQMHLEWMVEDLESAVDGVPGRGEQAAPPAVAPGPQAWFHGCVAGPCDRALALLGGKIV